MLQIKNKISPLYCFIDFLLITFIFYFSYIFRYNSFSQIVEGKLYLPNFREYTFIYILWLIFIIVSFKRRYLYSTDRSLTIPKEIRRTLAGIFYSSVLIGAVIFFAKYKFFSRLVFLASFVLLCIFLPLWRSIKRLILRKLIVRGFNNINVLIVGAGRIGKLLLEEINNHPFWGFKVLGFLDDDKKEEVNDFPILGRLSQFSSLARRHFIDEVIITIPYQKKAIAEIIKQAQGLHLGVRIIPEDFEEFSPLQEIKYLGILPLLTYKERKPHPAEFILKRVFDFTVSLFLIVILAPLFFIIAIMIKLDSPGPVFYIQKRMGRKGKIFNFYKFRSMVREAESLKQVLLSRNEVKDGVIFKIRNDPRITRIGRLLRRCSLDELPQIFNVLKGDMSLVGPRPFPVDESKKFNDNHIYRLNIRPGITGLAQVRGRSNLSFYQWVKWDLWYINHWSFGLDLKILWWTIPSVIKGKGAY